MPKKELEQLAAENLAYYTGTNPNAAGKWVKKHYPELNDFLKDIKALKPERLEISCAIITDRNLRDYRKMLSECVEVAK
jgi:hypothetical protein